MVDRGNCSFVKKARNAQHAGAAGLIIADNRCLCSDVACHNLYGISEGCENNVPSVVDDGSGGDITIPAFLMFKVDAGEIKKEVKDRNGIVLLGMGWSIPDSKVDYELWTVPSQESSKKFQREWGSVAKALKDHSYFTPHQFIYDGMDYGCHGVDGRNLCTNICTNNGRYCAVDPYNDLERGISGAEVVTEALRRICVWRYHRQEDGVGEPYWNYISEFLDRCDSDDFFTNKDCINDVYKRAKIDGKRIDSCMRDSGGTTDNVSNILLEREIDAAKRRGVVVLPTMFVNTVALRGYLSSDTVFSAICGKLHEGTKPDICEKCTGGTDIAECVKITSSPSLVPSSKPSSEPSVNTTSEPSLSSAPTQITIETESAPSLSSIQTQITIETKSPITVPITSPMTSPSSDATRVNCWNNIAITLFAVGLNYAFW